MLAEFLNKVAEMAKSAHSVQVVNVEGIPDEVLIRRGDEVTWKERPAPRRAHRLTSFVSLCELVRNPRIAPHPEVFHDGVRIVVVLDGEKRREFATLDLAQTERFGLVQKLSGMLLEVPAAVKLIRFDLHGIGADALVASLRRIDFTRKGTGAHSVEHGRESLGRAVEASVQQADQVPEQFVASVPLYTTEGLRSIVAALRVGVFLDVQAERVQLRPLADEISTALEVARVQVHELLVAALPAVPVFQGTPLCS